jgi:hypothetical protein
MWYDNLSVEETLQICQQICEREGKIKKLKREVSRAIEAKDIQQADNLTLQFISLIKERISEFEHYFNPIKIETAGDLIESYFVFCLNVIHKRLVRKVVDLPQYYKEIDRIQGCIERFTEAREL